MKPNLMLTHPLLLPAAAVSLGLLLTACDRASPPTASETATPKTTATGNTAPAPPAAPPLPTTESADIKVRVLAVKNPKEQGIDTSSGTTRGSLSPKPGARLVYVSFGITPKRATQRAKQAESAKPGAAGDSPVAGAPKDAVPEKKDTSLANSFASMVLREGDWLFASPFASLREEPGGTNWAGGAAVIQRLSDTRSGSGQMAEGGFGGVDFLSIPVQDGPVITMCSLAVGQESLITLGFFIGKDARQATLRIDGCADVPISLADWGE